MAVCHECNYLGTKPGYEGRSCTEVEGGQVNAVVVVLSFLFSNFEIQHGTSTRSFYLRLLCWRCSGKTSATGKLRQYP